MLKTVICILLLSLLSISSFSKDIRVNASYIENVINKQCDNSATSRNKTGPIKNGAFTTYETKYDCNKISIVMVYEEDNRLLLQQSHKSYVSIIQENEELARYDFPNDKEANRINFVLSNTYDKNNKDKFLAIEKQETQKKLEDLIK